MKKGTKLNLMWAAPEFDGSRGCKLGTMTDESEDGAPVVMDYIPTAFSRFTKRDSNYALNVTVVVVKMRATRLNSSATVELEGTILDTSGTVVAAFTAASTETDGGNERDNARLALNTISFAISKDLFPAALPSSEKRSAVIVSAPAPLPTVFSPAPAAAPKVGAPVGGAASPAAAAAKPSAPPAPQGTPAAQQPAGTAAAKPTSAPVTPTPAAAAATPKPAAAPSQTQAAPVPAKVVTPLIPAATAAKMTKSKALDQLWIGPTYDKAKGFEIGEVLYQVEERNDGIDKYLPEALAAIASKDAPCLLNLNIVELYMRSQLKGTSSVKLGVEGVLVAKDGTVLAAFKTTESVSGIGSLVEDCRMAARKVVLAITKELK
jgi:hypothetical protein